jgi:glycine/serine hydroxymethyltransferase
MRTIAGWIAEALRGRADASVLRRVRGQAAELCEGFPLYAKRRAEQK